MEFFSTHRRECHRSGFRKALTSIGSDKEVASQVAGAFRN
jgi:hypothetical protein